MHFMHCSNRVSAGKFVLFIVCCLFFMVADQTRLKPLTGAEDQSLSDNKLEDLRALLKVGLLPASPAQEAFLDKVVSYVAQGTLSLRMVEGTFVWARNQAEWPYPYFEQALRERARRVGVKISKAL